MKRKPYHFELSWRNGIKSNYHPLWITVILVVIAVAWMNVASLFANGNLTLKSPGHFDEIMKSLIGLVL
jgi:hypothetical protein